MEGGCCSTMNPALTHRPQLHRIAHSLVAAVICSLTGCTHGTRSQSYGEIDAGLRRELPLGATAPVPLQRVKPSLAPGGVLVGISGEVLVLCTVGEDGRVSDAVVEKCDYDEFAPLALEAVQRWTFVPGTRDGKPCAMRMLIPIRFEYPDSSPVSRIPNI